MVKKKRSPRKKAASKNSGRFSPVTTWIRDHKFKSFVLLLVMLGLGSLTHNLYLDKQNVSDMKNLLTAFERLDTDLETETGERFTIEASCESVGKFATGYSCRIKVSANNGWRNDYNPLVKTFSDNISLNENCYLLSDRSAFDNPEDEHYYCTQDVRKSNRDRAEEIFYKYDTTPGSAF